MEDPQLRNRLLFADRSAAIASKIEFSVMVGRIDGHRHHAATPLEMGRSQFVAIYSAEELYNTQSGGRHQPGGRFGTFHHPGGWYAHPVGTTRSPITRWQAMLQHLQRMVATFLDGEPQEQA